MTLEPRNWSDDDLTQLAKMRGAGQTYRQIAARFSVTRQAVAGILFRRMRSLEAPSKPPRHYVRKAKPKPEFPKDPDNCQGQMKKAEQLPKIPLKGAKRERYDFVWEEREALAINRRLFGPNDPLPLVHLGRCQCRYPVGEDPKALGFWLFCAKPTAPDESYCALHRGKIYAERRGK